MRRFKLKFGIDVDDILFKCNEYAVQLANEEHQFNPPLSITELEKWGRQHNRSDIIFDYYEKPEFFENQPVCEGAKEFIRRLLRMGEVYFVTAVAPEFMSIRAKRLMEEFPEVPKENIIMSYMKNLVKVDVLLDDGAHNVLQSESTYPVLMRKPWNQHMTGCLSVNNYEEFLTLIETIREDAFSATETKQEHKLYALIGPSASGKTVLMKELTAKEIATRVPSYTTRQKREEEPEDAYHFITKETFLKMEDEFFEKTRYAGECYGSRLEDIRNALKNNNVVMAMDICGAIALKKVFKHQAVLIYIKRDKEALIQSILERNVSNEEKTKRILSLNDERKNEFLCDLTLENSGTVEDMLISFLEEMEEAEAQG